MSQIAIGSTVYLSAEAAHRIRTAQAVVDEHPIDATTDRCMHCGVPGPCEARRDGLDLLASYGRRPRRRPGATQPKGIGGSFAWLGSPGERAVAGRHRRPE